MSVPQGSILSPSLFNIQTDSIWISICPGVAALLYVYASNAGFRCAWTVYKGGWQKITSNFLLQSQYASTFLTHLFLSMARYSSGSGSKVPWDHLWPQTLQSKQPSPIRNFAPTSRQHKITKEQQYHTADRRGHKSKNKISRKTATQHKTSAAATAVASVSVSNRLVP